MPKRVGSDFVQLILFGEEVTCASSESVRALARKLSRDYKNVYNDVQALARVGLIVRTAGKLFSAP